ncbi:LPS export ABC transporter periplasmic protein LptC [Candidatus Pelagibacter bacterium]|nr:LPS export ABC transporter periplasmic protein LptC [Candidatus Pelagibacter bacterium]
MKKTIQIGLLCFLLISLFFFYKKYFVKNDIIITEIKTLKIDQTQKDVENIIKNLNYEIILDKNTKYTISSDLSELVYLENRELIKMKKVKGEIIDNNKITIIITSDRAEYNSLDHTTKFADNVLIEYLNNKIFSDNLDLNFNNNLIKIYKNVKYLGSNGEMVADNINVNILTKKINIYMDNGHDNIRLYKN